MTDTARIEDALVHHLGTIDHLSDSMLYPRTSGSIAPCATASTTLAGDLHGRLERLGVYRREGRSGLPHVTVLRRPQAGGDRPAPANMCSIHVVRSALYRSSLAEGGARYDALETAALGG